MLQRAPTTRALRSTRLEESVLAGKRLANSPSRSRDRTDANSGPISWRCPLPAINKPLRTSTQFPTTFPTSGLLCIPRCSSRHTFACPTSLSGHLMVRCCFLPPCARVAGSSRNAPSSCVTPRGIPSLGGGAQNLQSSSCGGCSTSTSLTFAGCSNSTSSPLCFRLAWRGRCVGAAARCRFCLP